MIWQKMSHEYKGMSGSTWPELGACPFNKKCTMGKGKKESGTSQMIHKGPLEELSDPISLLKMKQTVWKSYVSNW